MLKNKKDVFGRLSRAGYRTRKKTESGKASLRDSLVGKGPFIDADFVEVDGDFEEEGPGRAGKDYLKSMEGLREYLKACSAEELNEIFDEILRIIEGDDAGNEDLKQAYGETRGSKKEKVKEFSRSAFESFSRAASREAVRIKKVSRNASSKASRVVSENKESVKQVSGKIYCRLRSSSPEERKLMLMVLLQIVILRKPVLGKNPAFKILLGYLGNSLLSKEEVRDLIRGISSLLRRGK